MDWLGILQHNQMRPSFVSLLEIGVGLHEKGLIFTLIGYAPLFNSLVALTSSHAFPKGKPVDHKIYAACVGYFVFLQTHRNKSSTWLRLPIAIRIPSTETNWSPHKKSRLERPRAKTELAVSALSGLAEASPCATRVRSSSGNSRQPSRWRARRSWGDHRWGGMAWRAVSLGWASPDGPAWWAGLMGTPDGHAWWAS